MTAFRRPCTQRRIVAAMLLFWLFALASSWANACVLQDRQTHRHGSTDGHASEPITVMAGHVGAVPAHGAESSSGASVCLEVCDAATQNSVQPNWAIDLPNLTLGPPRSLAWTPEPSPDTAAPAAVAAPPPRPRVPSRTLLSRLAL